MARGRSRPPAVVANTSRSARGRTDVTPSPRTDERARRIEDNLGLVRHVVRRFASFGHDAEELFQVGCIGLVKAIDRFDPRFGTALSTYAVPLILGEIQRYLRDQGPLAVERSGKQRARQARAKQEELRQQLGREPTVRELAAAVNAEPQELAALLEGTRPPAPLEETTHGATADPWEGVELRLWLDRLPLRERRVLALRYFAGWTQGEIGRALGISQAQVSRLEHRALTTLRQSAGAY